MNKRNFWGNSLEFQRDQLERYRAMSYEQLKKLSDCEEIANPEPQTKVSITVWKDNREDGGIQITIMADKSRWGGIFGTRSLEGFKAYADGSNLALVDEDLDNF